MVGRHLVALILALSALGPWRVHGSMATVSCEVLFNPYGVVRPLPKRELTSWNRNLVLWYHEGNHDFRVAHILDRSDYIQIREASLRVLERCPQSCLVVGIGRSPTPVTVFIENYEPGRAINLPLSNFRHHPEADVIFPEPYNDANFADTFRPLTKTEESTVFQHVDEHLLKRLRPEHKEILLLDVSEVGASLFSAERYIRKFFQARGIRIGVRSFAFTTPFFRSRLREMARVFGVVPAFGVLASDSHIIKTFNNSHYANLFESQFGEYILGQRPQENGIRHDIFVNAMRTHMFYDADLFAPASALPVAPPGYYADGLTRSIRGISDPSVTAVIRISK